MRLEMGGFDLGGALTFSGQARIAKGQSSEKLVETAKLSDWNTSSPIS